MPEIKVVLVEDKQQTLQAFARLLNAAPGFRCVGAYATTEEALCEIPGANPDVVLLDIVWGKGENLGIECAAELRGILPEMRIVMLTAYEDSERLFKALKAGADGYLLKSSSKDEILDGIREVVDAGGPMSPAIARKVIQHFHGRRCPEVSTLTAQELKILETLATGKSYKQIADSLNIALGTVEAHMKKVREKLRVHSAPAAIAKYLRNKCCGV